jgi:outer membrane protein OmpA-like peptidoglycan-associated protein
VVLLDASGPLAVTTARTTQVLTTPYATAAVRASGQVEAGTTTPAQVQARFGPVLATLPVAGRVYTLYFAPGGTTLTPASETTLGEALADIAQRAVCEVEMTGHTDTVGETLANDRLALERAEAVRALLVARGMTAAFVRVVGRGERSPVVATPDATAEPANRRVEVLVR